MATAPRDRPVDVAEPADRHHHDELQAEHDREGVRRDVLKPEGEHAAREARERSCEHEDAQLRRRDVDPGRGRGLLSACDRLQGSPGARMDQVAGEEQRDGDEAPHDCRVRRSGDRVRADLERPRDGDPVLPAREAALGVEQREGDQVQ